MGFPVFLAVMFVSWFPNTPDSIEIQYFREAHHKEAIAAAFQFELAPYERLFVTDFRPSTRDRGPCLEIKIEGVKSVEDFMLRISGDVVEYAIGEFKSLTSNSSIAFFFDERGLLNATLLLNVPSSSPRTPEIREALRVLHSYVPTRAWYSRPVFVIPFSIQMGLVIFVIVSTIRNRSWEDWGRLR